MAQPTRLASDGCAYAIDIGDRKASEVLTKLFSGLYMIGESFDCLPKWCLTVDVEIV